MPARLYTRIAAALAERAGRSADIAGQLRDGLDQLQKPAGGDWGRLPAYKRLGDISRLQGGVFFNLVRGTAVQVLYRDPEVWQLIGYGGNAMAGGGYLYRGFDDIDWLPKGS